MSLSPKVCKKNYKVHIPSLGEECEFWLVRVTDEQSISNPDKDHAYYTDDGKLFIYDGKNLVRVNCDICFTQEEREKLEDIEEGANKYVLPVATDNALGGIKTGFTQTEKQYAVEVTEEGQAYVTVPWTDTVYTLPVADTDTLGGVKLGYSQNGKNYPVVKDSEGNIYVAVPWEEYSLPQAETNTLGGIKTGYEKQGQNYPVLVDVDGNAYVNVPWTDTDTKYNVVSTTENGLAPMLPTENADKKFLNGEGEWAEVKESINGNTVTGSTFSGETSDCGVQILEVQGKTVQQTTNGYQLLDYNGLDKSSGGITAKVQHDGSIVLNGTSTTGSSSFITIPLQMAEGETVKININNEVENSKVRFKIEADDTSSCFDVEEVLINTPFKTYEAKLAKDSARFVFTISSNTTLTNFIVKPMLYQDGDGTWEPYTGGKPAPNPDYPMEIENVDISKIISHGRQLFDPNKVNTATISGATVTNNGDGSFTVTGSGNLTSEYSLSNCYGRADFLKKGTLRLKGIPSTRTNPRVEIIGLSVKGNLNMENRLFTLSSNASVEITDEILSKVVDIAVVTYGSNGSAIVPGTVKPMLYQDGDGTWEPYGFSTTNTDLTLAEGDIYENGQVTRVRKQTTFDGSSDEGWSLQSINDYGLANCRMSLSPISNGNTRIVLSNRFKRQDSLIANTTEEGIYLNEINQLFVRIDKNRLSTQDTQGFRNWLSAHNLTVEYELATPTTEELEIPTVPSYYPYTEVSTDSEVDPEITFRPLPYTSCLVGEATEEESGYMPKLSGNASQFLNGQGKWTTPSGYTLPQASTTTLGGVKIGSNITVSSGTISLTKANVVSALGYTPPTTNTTYSLATTSASGLLRQLSGNTSQFLNGNGQWATPPNTTYGVATTSKNGLMSATDKSRLDQLWAKFDSMVFFTSD